MQKNNHMDKKNIRIVFMGTPDFAIPTLERLFSDDYTLALIVTQPDKPVGRKRELQKPPIKLFAETHKLPISQPQKIKANTDFINQLQNIKPDFIVVVAYGKILPDKILEIPRYGCLNIHGSLLPKYRGASPIQSALMNGEKETGVTIIQMDQGMDTGDIIAIEKINIESDETSNMLHDRLAKVGAELLSKALPIYIQGKITKTPQNHTNATYTKIFTKEDGLIDWSKHAQIIYDKFRACTPWPGVFTFLDGKRFKIIEMKIEENKIKNAEHGTIFFKDSQKILVSCGEATLLELLNVQIEGKKAMTSNSFINGYASFNGIVLGSSKSKYD